MDVSIIVTCYNYEHYIRDAIQSCLSQKSSKISTEILVFDDGSTDNSAKVVSSNFGDRVKYFRLENSGIEKVVNFASGKASGKYLLRLDADDLLSEDYLGIVEKEVLAGREIIYTDYWEIDSNGVIGPLISLPSFDEGEIRARGDFLATGMLIMKKTFNSLGKYDERVKNSGLENYTLILDAIENNCDFVHVPVPSFMYRLHGASMSAKRREEIVRNGELIFLQRNLKNYSFGKFHPWADRR